MCLYFAEVMKCARVNLQERFKPKLRNATYVGEKPRRYCQRRMVNPEHNEDQRWSNVNGRFHYNSENTQPYETLESSRANADANDLCLTVQTLKFQGDVDQTKRCRTSFKYKTSTDGAKHRMFVKQAVDNDYSDDDCSSELTCYYYDDYVKYLFNNEKSRPGSAKSSILLEGLSKKTQNISTQVDAKRSGGHNKISLKLDSKVESLFKKRDKVTIKDEIRTEDDDEIDDTKIIFQKSGKRKSLTISRTQSPESVQVIRVDVVCNYSTSSLAEYDDKKIEYPKSDISIDNISMKGSHFADKYLLTNTIKKLDENLSGAKVTLFCKTFKLSERTKTLTSLTNKANTNTDDQVKAKESKKTQKIKGSVKKVRKQIRFL